MDHDLTYPGLAAALARHIHERYYEITPLLDSSFVRIFDDKCQSDFQIPAGVLRKLGILEAFGESFREHVFTCEPSKFLEIICNNESLECKYDTLVLALIRLVDFEGVTDTELFSLLVELGLCQEELVPKDREIFQTGWLVSKREISWTDKKKFYDDLYRNWPLLIA